ncbi:uncharacterized protein LAESUDRAFT_765501 [Laetiporus sulphureus 93-53]|uniref:JmjC domain-containing protein n=1 Tax=Laetiporus sulphureus 93-53 TaxID=1314785 RepID=A0A165AQM8_9APHY|nr:uncharacterized protein LAESUDRAFT_765501 [Laetiporus sulphureus 93-53]KZS99465.1 hypothetical protein LAESUDRAFT_765501 [Laetiporus sulphureus 93-53]
MIRPPKDFEFTTERLWNEYALPADMPVDIHDVRKRCASWAEPYEHGLLHDIVDSADDTQDIKFVLACNLSTRSLPQGLENLDDGLAQGWGMTAAAYPTAGQWVHPDNWLNCGWVLLHQAGVVTYAHQDSDGNCTWIIPHSGVKFWCYFNLNDEHRNLDRATQKMLMSHLCCLMNFDPEPTESQLPDTDLAKSHPDLAKKTIAEIFDVEVVVLYPGDALFQPPGKMHAVYTPVKSVAQGGHFFLYDTLHRTELARSVDNKYGNHTTNQNHYNAMETLNRMVLTLPYLPADFVLYERPLLALMVMMHDADRMEAQALAKGPLSTHANLTGHGYEICKKLARGMGYPNLAAVAKEVNDNMSLSPGDPVNIRDILKP